MKKLIVANWKMNPVNTVHAQKLSRQVIRGAKNFGKVDVVFCPPFPFLSSVGPELKRSHIVLGSQDSFWKDEGAYTGEVSVPMLKSFGVRFVLVGHSERRIHLGETDEMVAKKVKNVLMHRLHPIVCVGEQSRDLVDYKGKEVSGMVATLSRQIPPALKGLKRNQAKYLIFAYEPIWAIGTGKADNPQKALEAITLIRRLLAGRFGPAIAHEIRILYGGSVTPKNVVSFISQEGIDGVLVGGSSLSVKSFVDIVRKTGSV